MMPWGTPEEEARVLQALQEQQRQRQLLELLQQQERRQILLSQALYSTNGVPTIRDNTSLNGLSLAGATGGPLLFQAGMGNIPTVASTAAAAVLSQEASQVRESLQNRQQQQQLMNAFSLQGLVDRGVLQRKALLELQAPLSLIGNSEKADYLTALRLVSKLVLEESDPLRFLRFHNFNAAAAARAMVTYWKRRCAIFGDRALLPLSITGEGALNERDIAFVKTGVLALLPKATNGKSVLCIDPSRRIDDDLETRRRIYFYYGHLLSENDVSQTHGYVSIMLIRERRYVAGGAREGVSIVLDTFPLTVSAHHFVNCVRSWETPRSVFQTLTNNLVQQFFGVLQKCRDGAHCHESQDDDQLMETMVSHGLEREGLPDLIGGSWSYQNWSRWIVERQKQEQDRYWPSALASDRPADNSTGRPTHTASLDRSVPLPRTENSEEGESNELDDAREQMEEALRKLPDEEKIAYSEALQSAPQEVWKECSFELFIRTEYIHPRAAAKRLARYWTLRFRTLGPKRYDLLSQTGEASLRRPELALLGTGFVTILPNDEHGCPVIWIDGARLPANRSRESRDRCLFYMFSLLTENPMAQEAGAVLLYKMDSPPFDTIDGTYLKDIARSLPLRFKAVHVVSQDFMQIDSSSPINFGRQLYVHVSPSMDALRAKLLPFGMKDENLPGTLKGGFTFAKFVQWQEFRTRMEWRIPIGLQGKDKQGDGDSLDPFSLPTIKPYSLLPSSLQVERRRRLTVIHSRRKRDRQLVEADTMKEQCSELREEHCRLRAESEKLESLVEAAKAVVRTLLVGSTDAPHCDHRQSGEDDKASPASQIVTGLSGSIESLYSAADSLLDFAAKPLDETKKVAAAKNDEVSL